MHHWQGLFNYTSWCKEEVWHVHICAWDDFLSAAYHPYTHIVPSRPAYDANLTPPYTSCHWHHPLCFCIPALSSLILNILTLPQNPHDMPPMLPPHLCTHSSPAYHAYTPVTDP
ncbi:hypothetical protein O181_075497 [Austropuccinia psidii MF-1]|uniref:Uncharacterized protein n=1 Tax=Austropuccinia psidii MF-1 TaxID=1389203 RepID=A0A9Q3ICY2_9BASI|nr:hypothetical protein [Austropuccinia psidii MF-1]